MESSLFTTITSHLLEDEQPSIFLNEVSESKEFKDSPLGEMNRLKHCEQSKVHHPEGNVWIHTMMVVDEAAANRDQSKDPKAFMWAAFLHDLGKPDCTRMRKGKLTAYNHDIVGAEKTAKLLEQLTTDTDFNKKVVGLVRWHMQILFLAKNMEYADIEGVKKDADVQEVALLGLCDRLGRGNVDAKQVHKDIEQFLHKMK